MSSRLDKWLAGGIGRACLLNALTKLHFDPVRAQRSVGEQAFEQLISRFQQFLINTESAGQQNFGLIIHDNNQTISTKHTQLMRQFHAQGTLWTHITRIMETPLFVGSDLTEWFRSLTCAVTHCAATLRTVRRRYLSRCFNAPTGYGRLLLAFDISQMLPALAKYALLTGRCHDGRFFNIDWETEFSVIWRSGGIAGYGGRNGYSFSESGKDVERGAPHLIESEGRLAAYTKALYRLTAGAAPDATRR